PNFGDAMVKGTVEFMENTGNLKTASLTLADEQSFFIQDSNQNIDLRDVTGFDFDWTNVNLFDVETEENIGYVEA
ncbi:MAG: ABC transporter ATP-binding protein, partial [Phascolarctobacterium sp.]|nr:ABC transporter ATP-binding protein [Phascolarctobacterium sp.]